LQFRKTMASVWSQIRKDVRELVEEKRCGAIVVRLSWHDAGTFCKRDGSGGPRACMRFEGAGEAAHAANAGLEIARALVSTIKNKYPEVSHADFWALAACEAIEAMGGPHIPFRPGRVDASSGDESAPDGRLPDAALGAEHIREVFYRMGFDDQGIVALSGAHTIGQCRKERSGFLGPWTENPLVFDNSYFKLLLSEEWKEHVLDNGKQQWKDAKTEKLMMLNTDLALLSDPVFRKWTELYAADQESFFRDFAQAFQQLQELGVSALSADSY